MKVLITGAAGQVARALLADTPDTITAIGLDREALDVTNPEQVKGRVAQIAPDVIINTAAYTAVDRAENDSARAFSINRDGVANLAATSARLVQISTDFVFDGMASSPYQVDAPCNPLNVYGRSKRAGEFAANASAAGDDALIIRTAWVYAGTGANFVKTMLQVMEARSHVEVVADQVGTPTWAPSLAGAIWALVLKKVSGVYHFTDSGVATWYDFAVAIAEEALALGLLTGPPEIIPVATSQYPTAAKRPAYSVLDKSETNALIGHAPHWRINLRKMLAEVAANG